VKYVIQDYWVYLETIQFVNDIRIYGKMYKIEFDNESPYERFNTKDADGQALVHLVNLVCPDDAIGIEVGVFTAETYCTLLQNCPNIKYLYGIDNYKPYTDYLKEPYDGTPAYHCDAKTIDFVEHVATHNIEWSGAKEKSQVIKKDSSVAKNDFADEFADFIFIDTYLSLEQAEIDLADWYPKLKRGGIFSGHDWNAPVIQQAVNKFRDLNSIDSKLSIFDNTWIWIK